VVSLIRLIVMFIRFSTPWVIRAVAQMAGLIVVAVGSFWRGVPPATRAVADEWVERAVASGFPTTHAPELHRAIQFVALLMIAGAWVFLSHVTVWLVQRIL
jgi:hypothetical protein